MNNPNSQSDNSRNEPEAEPKAEPKDWTEEEMEEASALPMPQVEDDKDKT